MKTDLSFDDLNITKACEQGFEFEYVRESEEKESGVFITVLGSHSELVQSWVRKRLNANRQRDAMRAKRGKADDVRSIEDDIDFGIESAAIRITGWRGISQPFSPDNAILLCTINPEIRLQVVTQSDDIGNFTRTP